MIETAVQALSTLLAAALGAWFSIIVFRGGKRSDVAREQLDKVYAPAFRLVEPFLFQKLPRQKCDELVAALNEIALTGGILTDPALVAAIETYWRAPDGDLENYPSYQYKFLDTTPCYLTSWFDICNHIDRTYDVLCKKSFLPIRSIYYRLNRDQYINRLKWAINLLRVEWMNLLFFAVLIGFMLLSMWAGTPAPT